jgi:hypothetical protein
MQAGTHRSRVRVRVRSFVDKHVLRMVSEHEARIMCGENADGTEMLGQDGKAIEAVARRLSRLKATLTDIQLLARERNERPSPAGLTFSDVQNNAFGSHFRALGSTDSIRALDRAAEKVAAWPEVHDYRNVIVCAGKVHGVSIMRPEHLAQL